MEEKKLITLADVKNNPEIYELILAANNYLALKGYTEHGLRHVGFVSKTSANLLSELGYSEREIELAAITGWIHDIGNAVNRQHHGLIGANLAYPILRDMGMTHSEIITIIGAIGNHEDDIGIPVTPVGAALIIADKADAHRTRVRRKPINPHDIHDRVNLSIKKNMLVVDNPNKKIKLMIFMDKTSSPMDYMQIYLSRMMLCEKAAEFLGCVFELIINNTVINNQKAVARLSVQLNKTEKEVSEEL